MTYVTEFFNAVWVTGIALAPSLFFGLFIAGLLHVFVKKDKIFKHMGKPGLRSSVKASLIGVPLPLCSCGVLPAAIGLRKDGASKGAAVSFLTSTPQTGVDSFSVTWAMLGWPIALAKVIAAFIAGVVSGTIVDVFDKNNGHASSPSSSEAHENGSLISRIWHYAYDTLFRDIYLWLLIGIAISALVTVFIEPGQLSEYPVLSGPLGMLAALAIGIPLYVCSVSSVPIAAALVYAGFPVGSALVFLMAGPATNAATMGAVRKSLGRLSFWSYILTVVVVSLLAGLLLNDLNIPFTTMTHHHEEVGILGNIVAGVLFIGIAINLWKDFMNKIKSKKITDFSALDTYIYSVSAMTCPNCVRAVTEGLNKLVGVEAVTVSLDAANAVIVPNSNYSNTEILNQLEKIGHKGELITVEKPASSCSCNSCG